MSNEKETNWLKRKNDSVPQTDAVILCGGLGTRLRAVSKDLPKGMLSINGRPFLEILLGLLAREGFRRFILCTGYKSEAFREHFQSEKRYSIVFSEEREPLGTAGALKLAEPLIESDPFVVLNGDSLFRMRFGSFLDFHQSQAVDGTLALSPAGERRDGGFVHMDTRCRIAGFHERKYQKDAYLSMGVYAFSRRFLCGIPRDKASSLEEDIFPSVKPGTLAGFVVSTPIYDIGTPERLSRCQQELKRLGLDVS